MCAAALAGDLAPRARGQRPPAAACTRSSSSRPIPIPVKWALAEMGRIHNTLRLPLAPLSPQYHDVVRAALREAGCVG